MQFPISEWTCWATDPKSVEWLLQNDQLAAIQIQEQLRIPDKTDADRMNIWSAYRWMNTPAAPACQQHRGANYAVGGAGLATPALRSGPVTAQYGVSGISGGAGNYQAPRQVLAGGNVAYYRR